MNALTGWRLALLFAHVVLCSLTAQAVEPTKAPVATANAGSTSTLDKQEVRAQLLPRRYTTLAAEIGAKINRMPVPEGGSFRQGETLIAFDCLLQQTQLTKAKAALTATEKTWQANQRLNELNAVGKVELDVSEAEMGKAKAEVDANAAVISKCSLQAPFSGRIAEQRVREQQYVQPGQPLLEIIDDSTLELEFIVPSRWLAWLRPGYAFQVRIDETNKSYPARVQRIGARVDPVSQSVKLSAVINGRFAELISGMSGRVSLNPPAGQ